MKKLIFIAMLTVLIIGVGCNSKNSSVDQGDAKLTLDSKMQKTSYAMGYNMVQNLKRIPEDIDFVAVVQGVRDAAKGEKPKIGQDEIATLLNDFQQNIRRQPKRPAVNKELAEKNKMEGEKFLQENTKKEGVKVTGSGLQYQVMKPGQGDQPVATDTVIVHYRGTFLDGNEFDSSYKREKPIEFPLNGVIRGWTEGVQLMKKGAKFRFFIPANLAYGPNGTPDGKITPNATLIFEVELIEIKKGK